MRLLKPDGSWRPADELPNDDLSGMIFLISKPTWLWRNPNGKTRRSPRISEEEIEEDEPSDDDQDDDEEGQAHDQQVPAPWQGGPGHAFAGHEAGRLQAAQGERRSDPGALHIRADRQGREG